MILHPIKDKVCACKISLDYLGDKWLLMIVRDLFRFRYTFTDFLHKDTNEAIATNILSSRLKKLIELKIINYRLNSKNKKIKEYFLTDKGIELYNIIFELQLWALKSVDFNYSDNTDRWNKELNEKSREEIIEIKKKQYKTFRKEKFSF